jgi:hypothetical protein
METLFTNTLTLALGLILALVGLVVLVIVVARGGAARRFWGALFEVAAHVVAVITALFLAFVVLGILMESEVVKAVPAQVRPEVGVVLMGAFVGLVWLSWWSWQKFRGRR